MSSYEELKVLSAKKQELHNLEKLAKNDGLSPDVKASVLARADGLKAEIEMMKTNQHPIVPEVLTREVVQKAVDARVAELEDLQTLLKNDDLPDDMRKVLEGRLGFKAMVDLWNVLRQPVYRK